MAYGNLKQINKIEPASFIWHKLFLENQIPANGTVIEVAPGYEPKIGNALVMLEFSGTVFLIEPDERAAHYIEELYQQILPRAAVNIVVKPLQYVEVGVDVPSGIDALLASHPFDDMVMASIVRQPSFFSEEREGGADSSASIKKLYDIIGRKDYERGIETALATWKHFIRRAKPVYFIASQYPSRMLTMKGLTKRQESGFIVLKQLKNFYKNFLREQNRDASLGYKGDPKCWIIARKPYI